MFVPSSDEKANPLQVKKSETALVLFAKEFLSGEGNIVRHLLHACKYRVFHTQKPLDEYDFTVENLAIDLRDGVRLVRVTEVLTGDTLRNLSRKIRYPAVSRLQKLHNAGVALSSLQKSGISMQVKEKQQWNGRITEKDIIDGHRQKSLALLWKLIVRFQLNQLVREDVLIEEISRLEAMHGTTARRVYDISIRASQEELHTSSNEDAEVEGLLLRWCQAVAANEMLVVRNFTSSFSSGRVLCLLVRSYQPSLMPRDQKLSSVAKLLCDKGLSKDDGFAQEDLASKSAISKLPRKEYLRALDGERANFKLANTTCAKLGCMPIMLPSFDSSNHPEKCVMVTYISYLCSRLLASRNETRAAKILQAYWRKHYMRIVGFRRIQAAITIQRFVSRQSFSLTCFRRSITAAQSLIRSFIAKGEALHRKDCVVKLHRFAKRALEKTRGHNERVARSVLASALKQRQHFIDKRLARLKLIVSSTVKIQSWWRATDEQMHFAAIRSSLVCMQTWWRCCTHRSRFQNIRSSTIIAQSLQRRWVCLKEYQMLRIATITIQAWARSTRDRARFCTMVDSAKAIQSFYRTQMLRHEHSKKTLAATACQAYIRGILCATAYRKTKSKIVLLQTFLRGCAVRRCADAERRAAVKIQATFRALLWKTTYMDLRVQIIAFQAHMRGATLRSRRSRAVTLIASVARRRACSSQYDTKRAVAIKIQSLARARFWQSTFRDIRSRICEIQAIIRGAQTRKNIANFQCAVALLQNAFRARRSKRVILVQKMIRGYLCRASVHRCNVAASKIQACFRSMSGRNRILTMHSYATKLQTSWRCWYAMRHLTLSRKAVTLLQAFARGVLSERTTQKCSGRSCASRQ